MTEVTGSSTPANAIPSKTPRPLALDVGVRRDQQDREQPHRHVAVRGDHLSRNENRKVAERDRGRESPPWRATGQAPDDHGPRERCAEHQHQQIVAARVREPGQRHGADEDDHETQDGEARDGRVGGEREPLERSTSG